MGECFFGYRPTRVVPDKGPLNGCVCVSHLTHKKCHYHCLTDNVTESKRTDKSELLYSSRKIVLHTRTVTAS